MIIIMVFLCIDRKLLWSPQFLNPFAFDDLEGEQAYLRDICPVPSKKYENNPHFIKRDTIFIQFGFKTSGFLTYAQGERIRKKASPTPFVLSVATARKSWSEVEGWEAKPQMVPAFTLSLAATVC